MQATAGTFKLWLVWPVPCAALLSSLCLASGAFSGSMTSFSTAVWMVSTCSSSCSELPCLVRRAGPPQATNLRDKLPSLDCMKGMSPDTWKKLPALTSSDAYPYLTGCQPKLSCIKGVGCRSIEVQAAQATSITPLSMLGSQATVANRHTVLGL